MDERVYALEKHEYSEPLVELNVYCARILKRYYAYSNNSQSLR